MPRKHTRHLTYYRTERDNGPKRTGKNHNYPFMKQRKTKLEISSDLSDKTMLPSLLSKYDEGNTKQAIMFSNKNMFNYIFLQLMAFEVHLITVRKPCTPVFLITAGTYR